MRHNLTASAEVLTAAQFQAIKSDAQDRSAVVHSKPDQVDHAARLRGHLRAMGDYYDIPRESTEEAIKNHATYELSIADNLAVFANVVGIPEGPASFYIRQQELSQKI